MAARSAGARVRLKDMAGLPEHNGKFATALGYDAARGRQQVVIDEGSVMIAVRLECMEDCAGDTLTCTSCGAPRSVDAVFCPKCGVKVDGAVLKSIPPIDLTLYEEYEGLMKEAGWKGFDEWPGGPVTSADTLLVIDMQNDFLPKDVAEDGGNLAVAEGGSTILPIIQLIDLFSKAGALVVATRDYHPFDHCCFLSQGGCFPSHCVQGLKGSYFYPAIGAALQEAMAREPSGADSAPALLRQSSHFTPKAPTSKTEHPGVPQPTGRVCICFKGYTPKVDSFGAFKYEESYYAERHGYPWICTDDIYEIPYGCAGPWTGAMNLKCSGMLEDINAPPDVMAILRKDKQPLEEIIPKTGRLLVVGLALEFCVLDSAVNAAKLGYTNIFIAKDASRAVHIPKDVPDLGGKFGSGFTNDPAFFIKQCTELSIGVIHSSQVLKAT